MRPKNNKSNLKQKKTRTSIVKSGNQSASRFLRRHQSQNRYNGIWGFPLQKRQTPAKVSYKIEN